MDAGRYLSPSQVKAEYLPNRGRKWIIAAIRGGVLGPDVTRDGRGWLVAEAGVLAYLERHRVTVLSVQAEPKTKAS